MKCNPAVKNIYDFIDGIAPFCKQCEWDNSGLIVGDADKTVRKIGVVLDITSEAVLKAKDLGVDLIVSHHPVIFRATKSFLADDPAYLLASNGISAICAHTSLDCAKGGVNDVLAKVLGFENAYPISDEGEAAILRVAETSAPISGEALAKKAAEKLNTGIRLADSGKQITKIAFCGGAGGDFIKEAVAAGCDAYITGDASHHEFLEALGCSLTLIAAGHFETENPVVPDLAERIKGEFNVEVIIIPQDSPVKYF